MVLSRNNISVIKDSFIDVTNDIVPTIQYIVEAQGLNFIRDKVKIVFHNTPGFVTVGSTKTPCSTDLITLDKNLTQEEVGKCIDMSQRKISRLEKGDIKPTPDEIVRICKFYNVSADYILGLTNEYRRLK